MTSQKISKYIITNINYNTPTTPPKIKIKLIKKKTPNKKQIILTIKNITKTIYNNYFTNIKTNIIYHIINYKYKKNTTNTIYNQSFIK